MSSPFTLARTSSSKAHQDWGADQEIQLPGAVQNVGVEVCQALGEVYLYKNGRGIIANSHCQGVKPKKVAVDKPLLKKHL